MTDKEVITCYRYIVFDIHSMQQQIAWNKQHGLPVLNLPDKVSQLIRELIRFENILDRITDRRARNIILLRFVLSLGERDTADYLNISRATVSRICDDTFRQLDPDNVQTSMSEPNTDGELR